MSLIIQCSCGPCLPLLLFTLVELVGVVTAVVGLGRLHRQCSHDVNHGCIVSYSSEWFNLAFQLFVLLVLFVCRLRGSHTNMRVALCVFMTMASVRLMSDADSAVSGVSTKYDRGLNYILVGDTYETIYRDEVQSLALGGAVGEVEFGAVGPRSAAGAYLGGLIVMIIANFILLLVIGSDTHPDMSGVVSWMSRNVAFASAQPNAVRPPEDGHPPVQNVTVEHGHIPSAPTMQMSHGVASHPQNALYPKPQFPLGTEQMT